MNRSPVYSAGPKTKMAIELTHQRYEILISLAPRTAISFGPAYLEKIFLAVLFISKLFMKIEKRQWAFLCHDGIL
jgi:hypothetical protein